MRTLTNAVVNFEKFMELTAKPWLLGIDQLVPLEQAL